eukprot:365462-Chlamydomonas_euryale.AAC.1
MQKLNTLPPSRSKKKHIREFATQTSVPAVAIDRAVHADTKASAQQVYAYGSDSYTHTSAQPEEWHQVGGPTKARSLASGYREHPGAAIGGATSGRSTGLCRRRLVSC